MTAEHVRLDAAREQKAPWKKWGPYLSERQWGTVREDYSEGGNARDYFRTTGQKFVVQAARLLWLQASRLYHGGFVRPSLA